MDDNKHFDYRRYQLTMRLTAHRARTRTICDLTGYTRHQIATLRRRWNVPQSMRSRGPSPTSFFMFFRSARARSEAATLAVMCRLLGVLSALRARNKNRSSRLLEGGEGLCDVMEAFRGCFPESDLQFDYLMLLAREVMRGDSIALDRCVSCRAVILIDKFSLRERICSHCQKYGVWEPRRARSFV